MFPLKILEFIVIQIFSRRLKAWMVTLLRGRVGVRMVIATCVRSICEHHQYHTTTSANGQPYKIQKLLLAQKRMHYY
jgi:hypothetical protein